MLRVKAASVSIRAEIVTRETLRVGSVAFARNDTVCQENCGLASL
jgi:hypothetical protein